MAKSSVKKYGPQSRFVILKNTRRPGRDKVEEMISHLRPTTMNYGQFCFVEERQLPSFTSRRFDVTVSKFMNTLALCYASSTESPHLLVGGAHLQHCQGRSNWDTVGGKSYLTGFQAAHFGIGTLSLRGQAASKQAYLELNRLATSLGIPSTQMHEQFPLNSQLIAMSLANDASTYFAPAFVNQSEGKLEVIKQRYMKALLPMYVPKRPEALEQALVGVGQRLMMLLTTNRANIAPMENRLLRIERGELKGYTQNPNDTANLIFEGKESAFLEACIEAFADPTGELNVSLRKIESDIRREASDLAEMAEAAKEERASATDE